MIITNKLNRVMSLPLLIALSGFASLSWEVIWQLMATLTLGISAWSAAITLAVMMGGMGLGAFLMGRLLRSGSRQNALGLFGALEIAVGLLGYFLISEFSLIEHLDTWVYGWMPSAISVVALMGLLFVIGIPALCMGATLPVFQLLADRYQYPLAQLYSLNTFGAALGALAVAMILIPLLGIANTIAAIAIVNVLVGFSAYYLVQDSSSIDHHDSESVRPEFKPLPMTPFVIVFVSGFSIFSLEVAWFRSFASLLPNTTDVFAMLLACTLIALALAAKNVISLKQKKKTLASQLFLAGMCILLVTPLIEHLDMMLPYSKQVSAHHEKAISASWIMMGNNFDLSGFAIYGYFLQVILRFLLMFLIVVPPIRYLGTIFPWVIEDQHSPSSIGKLYAINTLAAVIGSLGAAWWFLPTIGFVKTAWLVGILVVLMSVILARQTLRYFYSFLGLLAIVIAMHFETGIGRTRVQGFFASSPQGEAAQLLESIEGPDQTISALEYDGGARGLVINSSYAAEESGDHYNRPGVHYMAWMGHLPMLLHPDPKRALVICFGTGQTSNAVRNENPSQLDIVDVNASVFKLARYFRSNHNVLLDPRVTKIVMDGRAYLRRTRNMYDVITLEPMPPTTVGVNSLYTREFYLQAKQHLTAKGVIAQWLPFHIAAPRTTASIAKTFLEVFPNAVMWLDEDSRTGILLGSRDDAPITATWPGFARTAVTRNLTREQILKAVAFNTKQLSDYAAYGEVITDDNQLLSYGKAIYVMGLYPQNFALLRRINPRLELYD